MLEESLYIHNIRDMKVSLLFETEIMCNIVKCNLHNISLNGCLLISTMNYP